MKNLLKCQEMMTIQWGIYQFFDIIKVIINSWVQLYKDKQIQAFPKKTKLV